MKHILFVTILITFSIQAFAKFEFKPLETWFYGGIQLGKSYLKTNEDLEAGEKDGYQYGISAASFWEFEDFALNVASSYYYVNFQSEREDNLKFNLITRTLGIEVSPLWAINKTIYFGPKAHLVLTEKLLVGPSDKENESKDDLTTNKILGLNAFYKYRYKEKDIRFGAHYHKPVDIGDRDVNIIFFSLELGRMLEI